MTFVLDFYRLLDLYFILTSIAGVIGISAQLCRLVRLLIELAGRNSSHRFYDVVDGYEMEVSWQWLEVTPSQRKAMCNGVGPEKWPSAARTALDSFTGFVAASKPHDVDYVIYRTKDEKLIADQRFFRNCVRIVVADAGGIVSFALTCLTPTGLRKQFHRLLLARALYRALRVGGMAAFEAASKLDFEVRVDGTGEPVTPGWMG